MSIASSPSQLFQTLGQCSPISIAAAGTKVSGWLKVPPGAIKLKAVLLAGTVGSTPTASLSAQQATSVGGAGAKNVAGITGTFGTVADTAVQVDFDLPSVLDTNNGFNFVQFTITNGAGSASLLAAEFETGPGPYLA